MQKTCPVLARAVLIATLAVPLLSAALIAAEDPVLAALEEQALQDAVANVADSVVQIRTIGGLEQVGGKLLSSGPTSGVIVSEDGYIVSSAANFAGTPTSILVRLPGGDQRPAELVGRDTNRMLVLLKVITEEKLPVPTPVPLDQVQPGQWAVSVGRVFDENRPNVSVGIVSAKGRMHGRVLQTDANVSTANYGGALVDVEGRVFGVLVPMAPQTGGVADTDELAGVEYYDSGIGFAVPLEHILAILPRWEKQGDLQRGLLGIGLEKGNAHATPAKITNVWPDSPAAKAGWQSGDVIVEINGDPIATQTELRYTVTPRYAGDELNVKIRRGEETLDTEVTLAAELDPLRHSFLGILPDRALQADKEQADGQDKETKKRGVVVRAVWPGSPAADAGIKAGDVLLKLNDAPVASPAAAIRVLNSEHPGKTVNVEYLRGGETQQQELTLAALPSELLSDNDLPATAKSESSSLKLKGMKLPQYPQPADYYQPADYQTGERDGKLGLLLWLADGDETAIKRTFFQWKPQCDARGFVLLVARPAEYKQWSSEDLRFLNDLLKRTVSRLPIDPLRVAVGGAGKSGQLAYRFAFTVKGIRGAAGIGVPLPRTLDPPNNTPGERLSILAVETESSPLSTLVRRDVQSLQKKGYPAALFTQEQEYGDDKTSDKETQETIARWLDSLDRF